MSKQSAIYKPLLEDFCNETKSVNIDSGFSSLFIPHTMPEYDFTSKKVFYLGRDTYEWLPTSSLMKYHDENNLEGFIEETQLWLRRNGFLSFNNNKPFGFWTMVIKLHLKLKGLDNNISISEDLPKEYFAQINDFGWGNTNAIEVQDSLQKQKVWESINKDKYLKVKEASRRFDKMKHIIDAFNPDLVFIFNWDCDEYKFLEGLKYVEKRLKLINNHFLVYFLPETNTHIIWTLHPNAIRFYGYSIDKMINEMAEYLENNGII